MIAVKDDKSPDPEATNPIAGVSLVHVYVVVPPVLFVVNSTISVTSSSQTTISTGSFISAVGFTVIVNISVGPSHPSKLGVTIIVAVTVEVPLFITLNDDISPLPEDTKPILGVLLVQLYVVVPSVFSVVNDTSVVCSSLHRTWLSI